MSGRCEAEVGAIKEALQAHVHKAPWKDVFKAGNLRRTMLVICFYTWQQLTGQAFESTYQTTFYANNGYEAQSFTYPIISSAIAVFVNFSAMYIVDILGCVHQSDLAYCLNSN